MTPASSCSRTIICFPHPTEPCRGVSSHKASTRCDTAIGPSRTMAASIRYPSDQTAFRSAASVNKETICGRAELVEKRIALRPVRDAREPRVLAKNAHARIAHHEHS